jgi:L-lactate dehydrogenase complex protein LldG
MEETAMANKEAFLNRIAEKIGRSRKEPVTRPHWLRNPWDHYFQGVSHKELMERFVAEATAVGAHVIRISKTESFADMFKEWAEREEIRHMIAWDGSHSLLLAGQTLPKMNEVQITYLNGDKQRERYIEIAERADAGLVYAEYGIAETGSVVLYNRGLNGRLVSLLPPKCLFLLKASKIVPRITQVLENLQNRAYEYSCINFITGPSRSGDIEMDLSIGVHGPGRVTIFLIEEE